MFERDRGSYRVRMACACDRCDKHVAVSARKSGGGGVRNGRKNPPPARA
jgi:hypothetical protein